MKTGSALRDLADDVRNIRVVDGASHVFDWHRRLRCARRAGLNADRCWAALHICILLVTAAAFFLPHLRLARWADFHPAVNYPAGGAMLQVIGFACGWAWCAGGLTMLVAGIASMVKATSIVHVAQADADLRRRLLDLAPMLGSAAKPIDLRVSDTGIGAFCWQIHRPVIALPREVVDFPVAEQAAIVRHELAHLGRQHPLHLFLQRMVEAIYWFHPLVWWASRQAAAAREICCDRDAVSSREEAAVYLRSLLRLVERQLTAPSTLPAGLAFLGDASLLSRRANLLADSFDTPVAPYSRWRTMLAFGAGAAVCIAVWLPVNPRASRRAQWSPWPVWSARTLEAAGIPVRDYEIDGHRLNGVD